MTSIQGLRHNIRPSYQLSFNRHLDAYTLFIHHNLRNPLRKSWKYFTLTIIL